MTDFPDRDEVLRLLGEKARDGNVSAQKALLDWHERNAGDPGEEKDGFDALDGSSNVTPIRRRSA